MFTFIMCFKLERMTDKTLINYNTCNALAVSIPYVNKEYTKQFHFFRDHDIYKLLSYEMRLRLLNDPCRHILLQNEIHNSKHVIGIWVPIQYTDPLYYSGFPISALSSVMFSLYFSLVIEI